MKDKTINIETEAHHKLRIYCATINCQIGDFTQEAITEKMEREPLV